MIYNPSLLLTGTGSALIPLLLALFTSSCQSLSPFFATMGSHFNTLSRCQTIIFSGLNAHFPSAPFINGLYSTGPFAPSTPHEAVITAFGFEASMRCASEADANPPNTTAWIAPRREIARIAKSAEGIMGTAINSLLAIAMDR